MQVLTINTAVIRKLII